MGWFAAPVVAVILASAFAIPLPDKSVQMVVTSPPYFGLRKYPGNPDGAFGQEKTVAEYVSHTVEVLREVRRVLKDDGVVLWNLGDGFGKTSKSLRLVPERVAIATSDDGWVIRDIIIWQKKNPVPESVKDRCTRSYEPILMLTKKKRYYWDAKAIDEPANSAPCPVGKYGELKLLPPIGNAKHQALGKHNLVGNRIAPKMTRKKRNVWTFATEPHRDAHVAQFPAELPRLCIKAGSRPGDWVLDPFAGSGTTGIVARELGRNAVLLDISVEYARMMKERLRGRN
jgi:DNA modification methylase